MSDIMLNDDNDILIVGGDIVLISTKERMVYQRLLNKLRTFTHSLWTNINYGVDRNLIFKRTPKYVLDNHYSSLIINTQGVSEIIELESEINPATRVYSLTFKVRTENGSILGIKSLSSTGGDKKQDILGIWVNGRWVSYGMWDNNEIWGSK